MKAVDRNKSQETEEFHVIDLAYSISSYDAG